MSGFEIKEQIGRAKAIDLLGDKLVLVEMPNLYDVVDLSGQTINSRNIYLEVKDRDVESHQYDTDMLEVSKVKAFAELDKTGVYYYLNFFTDGIARLYCLNKIKLMDIEIKELNCPASSYADKGYRTKLVYLLTPNLATTYKRTKDGEFKIIQKH